MRATSARSLVLLLLLNLGFSACKSTHYYSGAYPANWPVPELLLPQGATGISLSQPRPGETDIECQAPGNILAVADALAQPLLEGGWQKEEVLHEGEMGTYSLRLTRLADHATVQLDAKAMPSPNERGTAYLNEYSYLVVLPIRSSPSPASP